MPCRAAQEEPAGITADVEKLNTNARNASAQEAFKKEVSFSLMYTSFLKGDKADKIKEANKNFAKEHPDYMQHKFTDQKAPFSPTMEEETKQSGDRTGEKYCHGFYKKHQNKCE
ncbi:spermatogenesis-associated protein 16 [Vidua macroura]|uniref:spermatogenesis-associated protein 16 n=1 Tax=Vidua macroura TaxID=187451 RepID=UPI0023A79071|nr:spermatogenesis-associated protein 16 [Vidua macroura]